MPVTEPIYGLSTPNKDLAIAPDGFGYHFVVKPLSGTGEADFVLRDWEAADSTIRYL
jgi:hypothetical protein